MTAHDWPPAELTPREAAETLRALRRWDSRALESCVTWDHYPWLAEMAELIADFRRCLK